MYVKLKFIFSTRATKCHNKFTAGHLRRLNAEWRTIGQHVFELSNYNAQSSSIFQHTTSIQLMIDHLNAGILTKQL